MLKTLKCWLGFTALLMHLVPSSNASAQNIDIVTIYQNFIASRVAAARCNALDATLELRFHGNLMTVTIRATEAVKQRNPSLTDQQLVSEMDAMAQGVRQAVVSVIERSGCNNAGVQRLAQLYRAHGTMALP